MKKFALLLTMLCISANLMFADGVQQHPQSNQSDQSIIIIKKGLSAGGRSSFVNLSAFLYRTSYINVDITNHIGNVTVTIEDGNQTEVVNETYYVNGQGVCTVSTASLASGNYTLYINIGADIYFGRFEIE